MRKKFLLSIFLLIVLRLTGFSYRMPNYLKERILNLTNTLEFKASELADKSYSHFKGWNRVIDEKEQKILFSSSNFLSSVRLFKRFLIESDNYYRGSSTRTNLYNAFLYVANYFEKLKNDFREIGLSPYELYDIERIIRDIDREFSKWHSNDNLAYLKDYYVKGYSDAVYLIERVGMGRYVKRKFIDLESLYAYTYLVRRSKKSPWKFVKKLTIKELSQIPEGEPIRLTFEGHLVIQMGKGAGRPVYLIENGKKRIISSSSVLRRYGGWKAVYEVPKEVIDKYPEGEPVR